MPTNDVEYDDPLSYAQYMQRIREYETAYRERAQAEYIAFQAEREPARRERELQEREMQHQRIVPRSIYDQNLRNNRIYYINPNQFQWIIAEQDMYFCKSQKSYDDDVVEFD